VIEEVIESDSVCLSKGCLHRGRRANINAIKYLITKVVYIVVEERIYRKFDISAKSCLHRG
jgi:hypothetical protein